MSVQLDHTSLNRVSLAASNLPDVGTLRADSVQNGMSSLPGPVRSFLIETCVPWGIIIVDRIGRIVFATRLAKTFLSSENGLTIRNGRVHIERACIDRELKELISYATTDSEAVRNHGIVGVPGKEGRTEYAIKVVSPGMGKGNELAVLLVADLIQAPRVERSSLARLFALSDREAELAELLHDGYHVADIARHMKVAENTARVHLRGVFAKTGCNNQIDLARVLAHVP